MIYTISLILYFWGCKYSLSKVYMILYPDVNEMTLTHARTYALRLFSLRTVLSSSATTKTFLCFFSLFAVTKIFEIAASATQ